MNKSLSRSLLLWCGLLLGTLPGFLQAAPIVLSDNLAASTDGVEPVQGQTWVGAPFRTGSTAVALNSVDLLITVPQAGAAVLVLYTGTTQPETLVTALTSLQSTVISQYFLATFYGNGLPLAAQTDYWLVLASLTGRFDWAYTNSNSGSGVGFTPGWGVTDNRGASWFTAQSEPMKMRVQADELQPVPEPNALTLFALGIGFFSLATWWQRRRTLTVQARVSCGRLAVAAGTVALPLLLPVPSVAAAPAKTPVVSIVEPGPGEAVRTASVPVTVRVDQSSAIGEPLEVWLNGKSVGRLFARSGHCQRQGCPFTAVLSTTDGLRSGKNILRAQLGTVSSVRGAWQTSFDWIGGGQLGEASISLPPAVGFTTLGPGGGGPNGWVQIYSNQGAGKTTVYPKTASQACTTIYQVVALSRQTLAPKTDSGYTDGYACYDSDQALTDALKKFTSTDLVIAGTSYTKNALPQLNTLAIGGTNFGDGKVAARDMPHGYMVIGVGGAQSGQAYENSSTEESGDSSDNWARANGLLAVDANGHYNFHPNDYVEFKVRPAANNPTYYGSITVGNATYTPPQIDWGGGGFWLLSLDRRNLYSQPGCAASPTDPHLYPNCGTYYETDSPTGDLSVEQKEWAALAAALKSPGKSQLLILVAMSGPANRAEFPSADLADAINNLGGPGYALGRLFYTSTPPGSAGPALTLISSNDGGFQTALTGSAVVSSSVGVGYDGGNNGQAGYVKGILARDHNGLFRPVTSSQESKGTIDTPGEADFSAYSLFWSQPGAWPYMDTPGRVAAYEWLSYTLMTGNNYLTGASGAHLDDLRFYYTGSQNSNFTNGAKDPTTIVFPGAPGKSYCWAGPDTVKYPDMARYPAAVCFTDADLHGGTNAGDIGVAGQLKLELGYLQQSIAFLGTSTGVDGIGKVITGSDSAIANSMLDAMASVDSGYANGIPAPVSADASNWLKLGGSIIALGNSLNPAFGVVGGLMNVASQVTAPKTPGYNDSVIPRAFADYETTLSELTKQKDTYITGLRTGIETARDNVYSDWAKLQTVGKNVADTSSPWYLDTQVKLESLMAPAAAAAASRYAYLQLLPKYFQLDYWPATPVDTPRKIGTQNSDCNGSNCVCFASYSDRTIDLPNYSWDAFKTPGNASAKDIFVIGGAINEDWLGRWHETIPSADLLNSLFDPQGQLKLSRELFFSPNGPLGRRNGPRFSDKVCYNPAY